MGELKMNKMLAIAIAAGTITLSAENLLQNGGFENGRNGWKQSRRLVTGTAVLDTEKKTEGRQSIRLEITEKKKEQDSRQGLQLVSEKIPVKGGTELFYSFQLAMENVKPGEKKWNIARVVVDFYGADGKRIKGADLAGGQGTADWKKYAGKIKLPENCAFIACRLSLSDALGKIWVDDIILGTAEMK